MSVYEQINELPPAGIGNLLTKKICTTALAFVMVIAFATSASAQSKPAPIDPTGTPEGSSSDLSASKLAKEINNPVTDIWMLQFQFNNVKLESGDLKPVSGKWVNNLYFQPVLPVSLTKDLNLITRPVITLYNSVPYPMATVLSPAHTEPWIFGVGPTWIFPTAGSDFTGQGKWQVGPAVGGGYLTDKFMIAALVQQWWSFGGDSDREDTSQINIMPLIYRYFGDGWSVGYSGNILADWKAPSGEKWTVPLGLSLGKVIKFGMLPVQVMIAGQYFVERPEFGPKWNLQLQVTPVIPRLIKKTLFQ
jgi:hypothetical protein